MATTFGPYTLCFKKRTPFLFFGLLCVLLTSLWANCFLIVVKYVVYKGKVSFVRENFVFLSVKYLRLVWEKEEDGGDSSVLPSKNLWERWSLRSASDDGCAVVSLISMAFPGRRLE